MGFNSAFKGLTYIHSSVRLHSAHLRTSCHRRNVALLAQVHREQK